MVQAVHLPNGQTLTVSPVFGGYTFKSPQLDLHRSAFPPGWTVILQTQDEVNELDDRVRRRSKISNHADLSDENFTKHTVTHRFTKPTLRNDSVFLSSLSIPSSSDFKMSGSPTRQIALMLWSTLYWYFHKEAPSSHLPTSASSLTPEAGKPKADWRIKIKRDGILRHKNTVQKLERMGLISSEDSSVGADGNVRDPAGWDELFVSRRSFWQLDARIFLFTLSPASHSPIPSASPYVSRPSSPARDGQHSPRNNELNLTHGESLTAGISSPGGPFNSGSHLPTYYPPPPTQYIFTNHIRHPIRPKPPRQGETFYNRYIPSVDQWLSFRTPTLSKMPCPQFHPLGVASPGVLPSHPASTGMALPTLSSFGDRSTDVEILHRWMNDARVNAAWGNAGPVYTQQKFLEERMSDRHLFPVIGCWNGKPFGYFEIYWVKEDPLGRLLGGQIDDYARGIHALVGEQEYRGAHRVKIWLDALVHFCWNSDPRTETIFLEPRVDNEKFINYLKISGFYKQGEVAFPSKQAAIMKIDRESWESPAL